MISYPTCKLQQDWSAAVWHFTKLVWVDPRYNVTTQPHGFKHCTCFLHLYCIHQLIECSISALVISRLEYCNAFFDGRPKKISVLHSSYCSCCWKTRSGHRLFSHTWAIWSKPFWLLLQQCIKLCFLVYHAFNDWALQYLFCLVSDTTNIIYYIWRLCRINAYGLL